MATITINKSVTKGEELVIIPRKEYEELVSAKNNKNGLDKELLAALKEIKQGKLVGPFNSVKELKKTLEK
ncbi:MAG: hypothetical protein AAB861_02305 [Patescibacteria group bacterium]